MKLKICLKKEATTNLLCRCHCVTYMVRVDVELSCEHGWSEGLIEK